MPQPLLEHLRDSFGYGALFKPLLIFKIRQLEYSTGIQGKRGGAQCRSRYHRRASLGKSHDRRAAGTGLSLVRNSSDDLRLVHPFHCPGPARPRHAAPTPRTVLLHIRCTTPIRVLPPICAGILGTRPRSSKGKYSYALEYIHMY